MTWTNERIDLLKQLWLRGLSAAEIGKELDVSKNSVIGKVHRLGLPNRQSPIKTIKRRAVRRESIFTKSTIDQLVNKQPTCCWPIGDLKDNNFRFCGSVAMPGKPYCKQHYSSAYVTGSKKKAKKKVDGLN